MNATALETLERRLKATRDAHAGEVDRARNAAAQAAKAEARALELAQVITDLETALDELRGWAPEPADVLLRKPYDMPCPSCQARVGEPCHSPAGGDLDQPHATRGAPA